MFRIRSTLLSTPRIINTLKLDAKFASGVGGAKLPNTIPEHPLEPVVKRIIRHKIPRRRATLLLGKLVNEEFEQLKAGRKWPKINAGDAIEIEKLPYMSAKETEVVKGVVIGVFKRASDTAVQFVNAEFGVTVVRRIMLYSPLIKDVRIIKKAYIHDGEKRVRRSKIYYLLDRDPSEYTIA